MKKWSILIECSANSFKEFEERFLIGDDLNITKELVKGIMEVSECDCGGLQ